MIPGMGGRRETIDDELVTVITYGDTEVYVRDVPVLVTDEFGNGKPFAAMASPSVMWLLTEHALLKAVLGDADELADWMFEESANVGVPLP